MRYHEYSNENKIKRPAKYTLHIINGVFILFVKYQYIEHFISIKVALKYKIYLYFPLNMSKISKRFPQKLKDFVPVSYDAVSFIISVGSLKSFPAFFSSKSTAHGSVPPLRIILANSYF